jgi:phytoene/squalene synthetase
VTEAMHFFIGHADYAPRDENRYLAVTAAHITHMLRDSQEDAEAGYFNIPGEMVESGRVDPFEPGGDGYRRWTRSRVGLARLCFRAGRDQMSRVENRRCRLAGLAYTARFERILDVIEGDSFTLRAAYPDFGVGATALGMTGALIGLLLPHRSPRTPVVQSVMTERES